MESAGVRRMAAKLSKDPDCNIDEAVHDGDNKTENALKDGGISVQNKNDYGHCLIKIKYFTGEFNF